MYTGFEVPVRDGAVLRGLRYAPQATPAPAVLSMGPYGADRLHADGQYFAGRGLHFVSLDVRGRGDSDGTFVPFACDGDDGHDAVEWIAAQPWCSGEVVLYGGSYLGFVQWAIADRRPPALRAIAPVAAVRPGVDFPMVRNVPSPYAVRWLSLTDGRRTNLGPFGDDQLWRDAIRRLVAEGRPYRDLDLVAVGRRLPVFQEWLDHPDLDGYWTGLAPRRFEEITVPVLTITGQYDDDQLGALSYHDDHLAAAGAAARHDVVIGPWDHAGTRTATAAFGGLSFGPASRVDLRALHADWYLWALGRGARPGFLRQRVTYYQAGADRWRGAPDVPDDPHPLRLYPAPDGTLAARRPAAAEPVELSLDPLDTGADREAPGEGELYTAGWPGTALAHQSAPLPEPLEVTGRFRASLTLASELPDFDVLVQVYRIRPGGATVLLAETLLRARYHRGLATPSAWPAGTEVPVELTLPFVSLRTDPGDRLALVLRAPHRRRHTNMQAGGIATDESAKDAVAGTVRLISGPSHLSVPLDLGS